MADCPGVLTLAHMADGGLARLRLPGGRLTSDQARAVGDAAGRLGSGVVDLTSRANLQIRGLAPDGGVSLSQVLEAAGFRFAGEADRRRNILLDPLSGLDPDERRDLRPLAAALDEALLAASWIGRLSPKFSFALDGGGRASVAAISSDVAVLSLGDRFALSVGGRRCTFASTDEEHVAALAAIAEAAAEAGPEARAADISPDALAAALGPSSREEMAEFWPAATQPIYGAATTRDPGRVAVAVPVPVGRLDVAMLGFLADAAERDGDGSLVLAPWSAVVVPSVATDRAAALLARSEDAGFTPVAVARRLAVTACAGAPACVRACEPAKALARETLRLAARDPALMPTAAASLHFSACPKGCAGSASADLLLLGNSERSGWSLHRAAAPRRPGRSFGRIEAPEAGEILALLAARG